MPSDLFDETDDGQGQPGEAGFANAAPPGLDTRQLVAKSLVKLVDRISKAEALTFAIGFTPLFIGLLSGEQAVLGAAIPLTLAALGAIKSKRKPLRYAVRYPGMLLAGQGLGLTLGGLVVYVSSAAAFWTGVIGA